MHIHTIHFGVTTTCTEILAATCKRRKAEAAPHYGHAARYSFRWSDAVRSVPPLTLAVLGYGQIAP